MSIPSGKKSIIAVDVDDVLTPLNQAMFEFINRTFDAGHTWEEYTVQGDYQGYWERIWRVDHDEAEKRYWAFINSGALRRLKVMEGAVGAIDALKKKYELVIVSARWDRQIQDTHYWLDKHFPKTFQGVHFVPLWYKDRSMSKASLCQKIGASYLIDDNIEHCVLAAGADITALLFGDFGWNRGSTLPPEIIRVNDWPTVLEYFDGRA